jgi:hypothetical protein
MIKKKKYPPNSKGFFHESVVDTGDKNTKQIIANFSLKKSKLPKLDTQGLGGN